MQPMLEPSFSNSLLALKVSAFKHGLCTAWTGTSTLCCPSNKGQALRGTSTEKCARLSFIAVLEIARPSVCTHSTLGRANTTGYLGHQLCIYSTLLWRQL